MSGAERAKRTRRGVRRRPRAAADPGTRGADKPTLRTVRETSAGGLVVDGLDGPRDALCAALIGRTDRRGRLLWSLPKGHIEQGETPEQTAEREVAEETGITGSVLAPLGSIDYWFVTEGRRVHKTVHHYLLRSLGGELSDEDVEVTEVAWVPLSELHSRLAYADERKLAERAGEMIDSMAREKTAETQNPRPVSDLPAPSRPVSDLPAPSRPVSDLPAAE
ncbi:8-oxo-dGTP pyrophosphatase MutT (NUDIX family) [Rhodococcus sp. PvP016]|uniref:8-oxo-dGTP pyrophosphatase MutT (NUDIX family) n=1 Tax=Rhodococcoides corynebacterioides TaxID=53972 RepID=A0ABS2KXL8_9NOCA|nr:MULTISPECIES: NUDIX hydrolase [Rhodococcus]MBM7416673.1 8-oxo-dGTP pyrophosphatase MutT (NUDIX family) [Rhodococcus corynebacterioides]MBP1114926.1 8-oxo-dGTP pyrophosphatase MutT (NUDIX family) [Rhodococcus sp. PvP016]